MILKEEIREIDKTCEHEYRLLEINKNVPSYNKKVGAVGYKTTYAFYCIHCLEIKNK